MKQYCRYCVYLCVNNVPYCMEHKEVLSESYCKHTNNCKDFQFADVEPEFQDAFAETNGYHPRERKWQVKKQCDGQINLFDDDDSEGGR